MEALRWYPKKKCTRITVALLSQESPGAKWSGGAGTEERVWGRNIFEDWACGKSWPGLPGTVNCKKKHKADKSKRLVDILFLEYWRLGGFYLIL